MLANNHDNDNIGCCSRSKFYFIKFVFLITFSLIILIFCGYQIVVNPERDNTVYFSLITSILFTFVPPPNAKN